MNRRGPVARILAIILVVAVPLIFVPPTAGQEGATLAGTVYVHDDEQPVDGAVLHAGDLRTGEIYSSTATNDDGDFVLSGLPPAAYRLAVETDGGLYLVGAPVRLEAGQERNVQLAIQPDAADDPKTASEEDEDDEMGFMNNPLVASLMVIGGALVFGWLISELDDDDEPIASPFTN
jgi:hypothetical protein